MGLSQDLIAAKKALDKLHRYSDGVKAAGGKDATKKYLELNAIADKAIRKLPAGILQTRQGLELAAAIAKKKS